MKIPFVGIKDGSTIRVIAIVGVFTNKKSDEMKEEKFCWSIDQQRPNTNEEKTKIASYTPV